MLRSGPANRSVIALYRPVLEPLGLTHPQYLVMLALWERSPQKVKEIAETLMLDSATLSPLLKRLESIGMITRARDRTDERALSVTLTEQGHALRSRAKKVPGEIVARLGVSLDQLQRVRDELNGLLDASRRATRPPTGAS